MEAIDDSEDIAGHIDTNDSEDVILSNDRERGWNTPIQLV